MYIVTWDSLGQHMQWLTWVNPMWLSIQSHVVVAPFAIAQQGLCVRFVAQFVWLSTTHPFLGRLHD